MGFNPIMYALMKDAASNAGSYAEPAGDDIPKVFFGKALPQTKDNVTMPFRYVSKTADISGYCQTKAQGSSSMDYPKKNQTVKLYKDAACTEKLKVSFKGWGKQSKFCFKANWIDITHARNIVSARLWGDVVRSRSGYADIPERLRTSPNCGAVDGFPVKVYAAGIYQGRYTINIPKDAWMANMDDDLDNHCILCGESNADNRSLFRATASIDGSDWTDEVHDDVPNSIKTRWNEAITFIVNSTDEDFVAGIGDYFDVESLIDYYLFGVASCGFDAFGKNQLYMTYDGKKWYATMYDMDSTWGLWWNGSYFVSTDYARDQYQDFRDGNGNLLYIRVADLFGEAIRERWNVLKTGPLSIANIINRFEQFTDIAPEALVKEDYAATTGGGSFTGIPMTAENNIQQIRAYAVSRLKYVDSVSETAVAYSLGQETTFDGTSDYIDTGLQLFPRNTDLTIALEFSGAADNTNLATLFHCVHEETPWPGISIDMTWEIGGGSMYYRFYNGTMDGYTGIVGNSTDKHRIVLVMNADTGMATVYWDDIANATKPIYKACSIDNTLILGAKRMLDGTICNFWHGTIHNFTVYNKMLSTDEITAYLAGE